MSRVIISTKSMQKKSQNKKLLFSTFIALAAAFLFIARPLFAQTSPSATSGQAQVGQAGESGIANDFDNDVKQGKDELKQDTEAQKLQKDVVDGEDGTAGEGDGQNNQQGVDEFGDIQQAENNQGVNEDNQDINNSGIDEVQDANNLDEQSQEVINEHQVQEDGEIQNVEQGGKMDSENATSSSQQNESSSPEQGQPDERNSNQ